MSQLTQSTRLPAAERRQAIVEAAQRVFAGYRHFASKRELYLECLDAAWGSLRAAFEDRLAALGDHDAVSAIGQAALAFHASGGVKPAMLWMQALSEAGEDYEIRSFLRRQLRDVHDYVAGVLRRAQAAGGVPPDRDADAARVLYEDLPPKPEPSAAPRPGIGERDAGSGRPTKQERRAIDRLMGEE